ncbi:MAG: hypothetical protein M3Z25_08735 [Actinomycetota bacterium]|nr:hypothetical protein [Actinomycetota bacterium]
MTAVDPTTLRPDIRADEVRLGTGHTVTVYRCPYPSEGPVRVSCAAGRVALRFMYAHFVFTWPKSSQTVDIGHGTLDSAMPLWQSQPVPSEWGEQALTRFGESWVRGHLRRFAPGGGERDDA